jgi:hypothetical protein
LYIFLPPLLEEEGNLVRDEKDEVPVEDWVSRASGYAVTFSRGQAKTNQLVGIGIWKFGGREELKLG